MEQFVIHGIVKCKVRNTNVINLSTFAQLIDGIFEIVYFPDQSIFPIFTVILYHHKSIMMILESKKTANNFAKNLYFSSVARFQLIFSH